MRLLIDGLLDHLHDLLERIGDGEWVRAAALNGVGLPAATAPEGIGGDSYQVTGPHPAVAGPVIDQALDWAGTLRSRYATDDLCRLAGRVFLSVLAA